MKTRALIFALPIAGALALGSNAWAQEAAAPGDTVTALQKAKELIETGKYKEAAALCEHASKLASGPCPDCLLGVARAYAGAGQLLVRNGARAAESDDAFRRAVALDGSLKGEVRAQLAEALLVRARQDAARRQPAPAEVIVANPAGTS
jgi:hypothetical protein